MPHAAHEKFKVDVVELHKFFVVWFRGGCEKSEGYFRQRFTSRFAQDFEYVLPGGDLLRLEELTGVLYDAYASSPDFEIKIQDVQTRYAGGSTRDGDLAIVRYQELQKGALNSAENNARISSAVMKLDSDAPNGVVWLHLHETLLPE